MVNENLKRSVSACLALLVVLAAFGGAVSFAQSGDAPEPVADSINSVSPVGESRALGGTIAVGVGVVAVTAGVNVACEEEILICKDDAPTAKQMAEADALETKTSIHSQAASSAQYQANFFQTWDNDANGLKTIARTEGKQAYVRALENGSSEPIARSEARQAVADYFTSRQQMLISQWNTTVITVNRSQAVADNTSNLSSGYIHIDNNDKQFVSSADNPRGDPVYIKASFGAEGPAKSVPLANGSTAMSASLTWSNFEVYPNANYNDDDGSFTETSDSTVANMGKIKYQIYSNTGTIKMDDVLVKPPNENFDSVQYVKPGEYASRWSKLQQFNTEVQNNLDDFVNLTYSQWDADKIDSSDLVDPYLGAREYDPQNSSSWALRSAMAMGINPPSNTSDIASMTVTNGGQNLSGLLMTPGDYTLETSTVYNASNQTGTQYLFNPETGEMQTLSGEYTINGIEGTDGSSQSSVTYENTRASATNLTEFKQRMEKNQEYLAEIEARQKALRDELDDDSGGWLEGLGVPPYQAFGLAALFLLILGIVTRS